MYAVVIMLFCMVWTCMEEILWINDCDDVYMVKVATPGSNRK